MMPAFTHSDPATVVIQFDRDGDPPIRRLVIGDGERVLLHAVALLIQQRALRLHDRLVVIAAESDDDGAPSGLPEFSRASHAS
jgi:hypothetical protein